MKGVILGMLCLSLLVVPVWAGEKEELTLQKALLQERLARYQVEYELITRQIAEIDVKLKAVLDKEPKPAPPPAPKPEVKPK